MPCGALQRPPWQVGKMKHPIHPFKSEGFRTVKIESIAARKSYHLEALLEPYERAARDIAETCNQQSLHTDILATRDE